MDRLSLKIKKHGVWVGAGCVDVEGWLEVGLVGGPVGQK